MEYSKVKIEVYAPPEFVEPLREALTRAGACHVGNYDHVLCWFPVQGCWRPLPGSSPYDGEVGRLQTGNECKLEARCPVDCVPQAVEAIRSVHPYEEPVINLVPLLNDRFRVE